MIDAVVFWRGELQGAEVRVHQVWGEEALAAAFLAAAFLAAAEQPQGVSRHPLHTPATDAPEVETRLRKWAGGPPTELAKRPLRLCYRLPHGQQPPNLKTAGPEAAGPASYPAEPSWVVFESVIGEPLGKASGQREAPCERLPLHGHLTVAEQGQEFSGQVRQTRSMLHQVNNRLSVASMSLEIMGERLGQPLEAADRQELRRMADRAREVVQTVGGSLRLLLDLLPSQRPRGH